MKHKIISFTGIFCISIMLFPVKGETQVKISEWTAPLGLDIRV